MGFIEDGSSKKKSWSLDASWRSRLGLREAGTYTTCSMGREVFLT